MLNQQFVKKLKIKLVKKAVEIATCIIRTNNHYGSGSGSTDYHDTRAD
jgi:hypothetical protein